MLALPYFYDRNLGKPLPFTFFCEFLPIIIQLFSQVVIESLKVVLEAEHYPLLLMSRQGSHRTGTVVGCLRKLQVYSTRYVFLSDIDPVRDTLTGADENFALFLKGMKLTLPVIILSTY